MLAGIGYALLSGICNGLFSAPMKVIPRWKWENIWAVFVLTSCLAIPIGIVSTTVPDYARVFAQAPRSAVICAVVFGFAWGFGAILFGLGVDRLGVSVANTLVIGLSSALGSLVPLVLGGKVNVLERRQQVLLLGVLIFIAGVWLCGKAGRRRDAKLAATPGSNSWIGYVFAVGAGIMSAVFNIGYTLAMPIAKTGQEMGYSSFLATNCIWLLMLCAGSVPNLAYCALLARKHGSARLFVSQNPAKAWLLSITMGLLWGASIFLYGAAAPLLGDIGPSIGWPLSLAVALLTANFMGVLLREWRGAPRDGVRLMRIGIGMLLGAIVLCALSAKAGS
ncbi:MAG: L-rhamnose/proton symporter RhaT [Bryobacteraceae bacterium]